MHLSQSAFGAIGGVGKQSQINYESGKRLPDSDYLAKLAAEKVDVLYVLTGRREPSLGHKNKDMFETLIDAMAAAKAKVSVPPAPQLPAIEHVTVDGTSFARIPLHEAFLAAGNGAENTTEHVVGHLAFENDWLRELGVSPSNAVLARAKGDSMQPVIWDGDTLLIDRSKIELSSATKPENAKRHAPVFALLDDGQAKVKRLRFLEQDLAVLISDNPEYPPQFAKVETLQIIGKVVWWGHTNRD